MLKLLGEIKRSLTTTRFVRLFRQSHWGFQAELPLKSQISQFRDELGCPRVDLFLSDESIHREVQLPPHLFSPNLTCMSRSTPRPGRQPALRRRGRQPALQRRQSQRQPRRRSQLWKPWCRPSPSKRHGHHLASCLGRGDGGVREHASQSGIVARPENTSQHESL